MCVSVSKIKREVEEGGETPFCNMACTHHFTCTNSHQTCLSSGQREREREREREKENLSNQKYSFGYMSKLNSVEAISLSLVSVMQ